MKMQLLLQCLERYTQIEKEKEIEIKWLKPDMKFFIDTAPSLTSVKTKDHHKEGAASDETG